MKNIEVSWQLNSPPSLLIDFGMFPAHKKNKIKVEQKFWREYVLARGEFERMHGILYQKIDDNKKRKLGAEND